MILDKILWKDFKYEDLFIIERGKGPRINNIEKGQTPFITATEINNGLTSFVDFPAVHKGNCITVNRNGSIGQAFYQKHDFCSTEDVHIFYLKFFKLNKEIAFFLITLIKKEKYRFGYGRKWGIERMKKSIIKLPVDSLGNPNWEYIENYIKKLWDKKIINLDEFKKSKNQVKIGLKPFEEWKEFKIKDIFIMERGKRLKSEDREVGNINYHSASEINNALTDKISNPIFTRRNKLIYTTFGDCFYVKNEFTASDEITILSAKEIELNAYIGLFLATILNKNKYKYAFGRKAFMNKFSDDKIKLPVNFSGSPDWEYMENYIKSLPYSNKL